MSAIESKVRVLKRMPTQKELPIEPGQSTEFFDGQWRLPDQSDLPCEDGAFVNNNLELLEYYSLGFSLAGSSCHESGQ